MTDLKKYGMYFIILLVILGVLLVGCKEKEKPQLEDNQPVSEIRKEITEGDFIYRLVSEKEEYVENGPVGIYAELEYIGDKEEINIYHAASPFFFPMVEKTRDFEIDYAMNEPLLRTTLVKGEPLREDYIASGGYSLEDEEEYISFVKSIVKSEFPAGEYVVDGAAVFYIITNEETDEKIEYNIKTQIEFKVK